jgi:AAA family ATP:ADP antiporter
VRRDEWVLLSRLLALFCLLNFLIDAVDVLATSDYVSSVGTDAIPLIWSAVTVTLVIVSAAYTLIADRFPRREVLRIQLAAFGLVFVVLWALLNGSLLSRNILYNALYLLTNVQMIMLPLAFWPVASDQYNVANSARLFPAIAMAGLIGKIIGDWVGGLSVAWFSGRGLSGNDLLVIGGGALLMAALFIPAMVPDRRAADAKSIAPRLDIMGAMREGMEFVRDVPLFRYLAIIFFLNQLVITVLDYQYLVVGVERFPKAADFSVFFGGLRALWSIIALSMQILIVSRLSKRLGPKNIFFIVPGALAAGMACAAAVYAFISVVVVRFAASVLATTFERPARKAVQGLAPEGKRGRVTTFIDSFLFAIAQIVGCALLGGGILLRRTGVLSRTTVAVGYLAVGAICALLAVYFVMRLRATYDSSLMNWRLARRKRAAVIADIDF